MEMTFDEWLYKVCEYIASKRYKGTPHDVYQAINLTSAKLAWLDGTPPELYENYN